ncbi:hypothetical protein F4818DRAFT_415997 [Hypoxylon cercidicola]|nr:hypothetical protein F4818DRAFT_415997 [Hypoxylon cercidicola]
MALAPTQPFREASWFSAKKKKTVGLWPDKPCKQSRIREPSGSKPPKKRRLSRPPAQNFLKGRVIFAICFSAFSPPSKPDLQKSYDSRKGDPRPAHPNCSSLSNGTLKEKKRQVWPGPFVVCGHVLLLVRKISIYLPRPEVSQRRMAGKSAQSKNCTALSSTEFLHVDDGVRLVITLLFLQPREFFAFTRGYIPSIRKPTLRLVGYHMHEISAILHELFSLQTIVVFFASSPGLDGRSSSELPHLAFARPGSGLAPVVV